MASGMPATCKPLSSVTTVGSPALHAMSRNLLSLACLVRCLLPACLVAFATLPLGAQTPDSVAPRPDTLLQRDTVAALAPSARLAALRVCAGGDVTLGTNLDTTWAVRNSARSGTRIVPLPDPSLLLRPLRPLVQDADIVLLNVEGAIGEGPFEPKCGPNSRNCYAFRQPIAAAAALRALGGDAPVVGNIANNHAGDAGQKGRRETIAHLEAAGVHVTGEDTLATIVTTTAGDTVAFLGFSTSSGPDPRDLGAVRRHVERASERYARVVVTMHMGAEGAAAQRTPDSTEIFLGTVNRGNSVAFARTAVEAGADLIVGHGPHVMRAMEWRDDALIMYSLGNLLTYGPFSFSEPMNRGAIACALMAPDGRIESAALRSTVQTPPGRVRVDGSGRAAALVDSLSRLDAGPRAPVVRVEAAILRPDTSSAARAGSSGSRPR